MPCYDGREAQDKIDTQRRKDALTAILCGVMGGEAWGAQEHAKRFAERWHANHKVIDQLRKEVKYDWENPAIGALQRDCDAILDEAYKLLCE